MYFRIFYTDILPHFRVFSTIKKHLETKSRFPADGAAIAALALTLFDFF
jgi:hypothetical protein